MFEGNEDVAFGDVNLQESAQDFRGEPNNPGLGGWPTIRFFNKETGTAGGNYKKVTDLPMCQELLDRMRMIDYIEGYGKTVLCGLDGKNCNEKELGYLEKMKAENSEEHQKQMDRLVVMTSNPMNSDLEEWAFRRMRILKKLLATSGGATSSEL